MDIKYKFAFKGHFNCLSGVIVPHKNRNYCDVLVCVKYANWLVGDAENATKENAGLETWSPTNMALQIWRYRMYIGLQTDEETRKKKLN